MQRGCAGGSGRGYYAPGLRVDVPGRPSLGCSRPFTSCGAGEMRNERLRALLLERGKTPDQLADAAQVDAKTVERWITKGRTPYRRHRFEVATFLGVDESYIWPDALGRDEVAVVSESEVVAQRGEDEGVGDAQAAKIHNALAMYRPLRQVEGVEFRFHRTVLYNSIYRADDQVLVNTHLFGVAAAQAPAWHLRKLPGGELASLYIDSFERIWETATPMDGD